MGKEGQQGDIPHAREGNQARMGGGKRLGLEAEPVHAGVHLEMQVELDAALAQVGVGRFQPGQLLVAMDGRLQAITGHGVQILETEETLQ